MKMLIDVAVTVAISVIVYIVCGGIVGAMARRGWDPIAAIARFLSPDPSQVEAETEGA